MFLPASIIQKKRDGHALTAQEIKSFIDGILSGQVTDYQATAFLMAVYFKDMSLDETVALTQAMIESGERYTLKSVKGPKVDKHSTGGVGDKVSLILAPLAAACGLIVPMMAGRGLGHSGGTLDKLESIKGFKTNLTREQFEKTLADVGCAIIGQTNTIAPADKKLYALRDVTATVDCIPLIVGSILSKKIAEGTEALLLDVKVGNGAFMKNIKQARLLALNLTRVAKKLGINCRAVLSDMNQPLGCTVGNTLEIIESIKVLKNETLPHCTSSSLDLKELTLHLCAQMLQMGGICRTHTEGRKLALDKLTDGSAWKLFIKMVEAQGGDSRTLLNPDLLPLSKNRVDFKTKKRGYITQMDTEQIGFMLIEMGGGRKTASDEIDHSVGFCFHNKLGARVQPGDPIATVYLPEKNFDSTQVKNLEETFFNAVTVSSTRKPVPKLILDPGIK